jgi:Co/Zn/Cd efflux system component
MHATTFRIAKMDCPAEEQLIRLKLAGLSAVVSLEFDIPARKLVVLHTGEVAEIQRFIDALDLDATLIETVIQDDGADHDPDRSASERSVLWIVLAINFAFFLIEAAAGVIAGSMGLVADSLDMLADSIVYGLALVAVGRTAVAKRNVAHIAGYVQLGLALLGLLEVIRRTFGYEAMPDFGVMIVVSMFALAANVICLLLLQRARSGEPHIRASMIFTSNDIVINLGVAAAGGLVYITGSIYPDLVIGGIVFAIVMRGATRILRL